MGSGDSGNSDILLELVNCSNITIDGENIWSGLNGSTGLKGHLKYGIRFSGTSKNNSVHDNLFTYFRGAAVSFASDTLWGNRCYDNRYTETKESQGCRYEDESGNVYFDTYQPPAMVENAKDLENYIKPSQDLTAWTADADVTVTADDENSTPDMFARKKADTVLFGSGAGTDRAVVTITETIHNTESTVYVLRFWAKFISQGALTLNDLTTLECRLLTVSDQYVNVGTDWSFVELEYTDAVISSHTSTIVLQPYSVINPAFKLAMIGFQFARKDSPYYPKDDVANTGMSLRGFAANYVQAPLAMTSGLLSVRHHIGSAAPTAQPAGQAAYRAGSDIIWNTGAAASGKIGWVCTGSGTFSAATDATGDTDGSTAVITGMTDTSDFAVGEFVTVSAGFAAGPIEILAITSTTMTLASNSTSSQTNVTVATVDPVFKAFGVIDA